MSGQSERFSELATAAELTERHNVVIPPPRYDGFHTQVGARFCELFFDLQRETGEMVPPRSVLTMRRARAVLRDLSILDMESPQRLIVRLVGTGVCRRMGYDGTGSNFLETVDQGRRTAYWRHFENLLMRPCGACALFVERFHGFEGVAENVSFPFSDKDGQPRFSIFVSEEAKPGEFVHTLGGFGPTGQGLAYRQIDIGAGTTDHLDF